MFEQWRAKVGARHLQPWLKGEKIVGYWQCRASNRAHQWYCWPTANLALEKQWWARRFACSWYKNTSG